MKLAFANKFIHMNDSELRFCDTAISICWVGLCANEIKSSTSPYTKLLLKGLFVQLRFLCTSYYVSDV
ncbi:hypothetical protein K470107D9_05220 [Sutterella wadsworthensis]